MQMSDCYSPVVKSSQPRGLTFINAHSLSQSNWTTSFGFVFFPLHRHNFHNAHSHTYVQVVCNSQAVKALDGKLLVAYLFISLLL
jgi:hypothetical protein